MRPRRREKHVAPYWSMTYYNIAALDSRDDDKTLADTTSIRKDS
jgi:hypothetical protein